MWGQVFVFFGNSWVRVFENKKFKKSLRSNSYLFEEDSKNHLGPGLRNPKRDIYEVGMRIRVCDQPHIRLDSLTKPLTSTKKFLYQGFWKTPFKTHARFLTMSYKVGSLPGFKTSTNNLKFFKLTRQEGFFLGNLKMAKLQVF